MANAGGSTMELICSAADLWHSFKVMLLKPGKHEGQDNLGMAYEFCESPVFENFQVRHVNVVTRAICACFSLPSAHMHMLQTAHLPGPSFLNR